MSTLDELRRVLGEDVVELHDPVPVDGPGSAGPARAAATLRPGDADELSTALGWLSRHGLAAVVRGGGTRLASANPSRRADVWLSTERLAGLHELDADDGVARVGAGTRLDALRDGIAARAPGWELPLDPAGATTTAGGALATAACGPRLRGYGPPRDHVLGLDVVLASGERTRCGGRVVKNVTGYDLAKLYVGSWGSLGVIESAWLRLRPTPERVLTRVLALADDARLWPDALAAARLGTVRAASLLRASGAEGAESGDLGREAGASGAWLLLVELAGDARAAEHDAALLDARGAREASDGALARVRESVEPASAGDALHLRVAALPGRIGAVRERLDAAHPAAVLRVDPEPGLVFARMACPDPADAPALDRLLGAARKAACDGRGSMRVLALPAWARLDRDVFDDPGGAMPLMRALKQQFDPKGVLNPGRFVGGL